MSYLGDGQTYQQWVSSVRTAGGEGGITWPFADQFQGSAAARFPVDKYTTLVSAGIVDPNAVNQQSGSGLYVYVLAPQSVQDSAPQVMTTYQRLLNYGFSQWDDAVSSFKQGLAMEGQLVGGAFNVVTGGYGKYILIGGAAVAVLLVMNKLGLGRRRG